MLQQTPENEVVSRQVMRRAETTIEEMRAGEGTGSGCSTHESPGPGNEPWEQGETGGAATTAASTHQAAQATGEAEVGHVPGDRQGELGVAMAGDDRVDDALESRLGGRMACRTSGFIERILSVDFRPTAQVRQVHQLRQALTRVPGAVPRGKLTAAKARLMARTELGVAADRRPRA